MRTSRSAMILRSRRQRRAPVRMDISVSLEELERDLAFPADPMGLDDRHRIRPADSPGR